MKRSGKRLILVTGAPRTATTPVGNLLAQCRGAVSLYEPLGPTGLSWIDQPFPIVGDQLGIAPERLDKLIDDLAALKPGRLKRQARPGRRASLKASMFGSRTLHSLRLARLQPWARTLIWKDPHAVLLVPDLIDRGVDVVVTARTPWAHAASYKRLGWRSKAAALYGRWARRYGACERCERYLPRADETVIGSALLWRLSYLPLVRTGALEKVRLITSEDLERDERAAYARLIASLGLTPTAAVERTLAGGRRDAGVADMGPKAHDWTRSVASVNRYWAQVLDPAELDTVRAITDDLVGALFHPPGDSAQA